MQLNYNPITIDTYLQHHNYIPIQDSQKYKLIQLNNLKLVEIKLSDEHTYSIQEVTQGKSGETWADVSIGTIIEHFKRLEGGSDTFSIIWHVDDVLSLNQDLSKEEGRLVLTMATDNHDANTGINWQIITKYIKKVLKMKESGII